MRSPRSSAARGARHRLVHILEQQRIGQQSLERRVEIIGDLCRSDAARRQQPRQHGRHSRTCERSRRRFVITRAQRQRRPEKERANREGRAATLQCASASMSAPMARLDPAHRAGGRAHHHAFGGDEIAVRVHAGSIEPSVTPVAENTTSPDTRSVRRIFAVEILDARFGGAGALVIVAEHQPRLHLAADTAQRRRRQHAFGRAALARYRCRRRWPDRWSRSRPPRRRR